MIISLPSPLFTLIVSFTAGLPGLVDRYMPVRLYILQRSIIVTIFANWMPVICLFSTTCEDYITSVGRLRIRCISRVLTASNFFITALYHMVSSLPGLIPSIKSHILNIRIQVVTSGLRQRSFRLLLSSNIALGFYSVTRLPMIMQLPLR